MKTAWRFLSCVVTLTCVAGPLVNAQPATAPSGAGETPAPLLPGRPDMPESGELGPVFESQSAGIRFNVPMGCRPVLQVSADLLAEFDNPDRLWTLKLARMQFDTPKSLVNTKAADGSDVAGLMDTTLGSLKTNLPEAKVLRQDMVNIQNGDFRVKNNVALLVLRYTMRARRQLCQQALIQANDHLFYILTLRSPGRQDDDAPGDDPAERNAVDTFQKVLDTVKVLDTTAIKHDQDERLFRTRALLYNITAERMRKVLIPEQWLRILHDGKDGGYTAIYERTALDIPRIKRVPQVNPDGTRRMVEVTPDITEGDGILIGIRSRVITEGARADKTNGPIQLDTESWLFTTATRKNEDWSRTVVLDDHSGKKQFSQEVGTSNKRIARVREKGAEGDAPLGGNGQGQPRMSLKEEYIMNVEQVASTAGLQPLTRMLPPFYIPQAVGHLLPRLLDLRHPKGYLVATYVSDVREVMMRYIDVLPEELVTLNGQSVRAVRINERLGLEGSVTTHYYTPEGAYLGSENKDTKTLVLPADKDSLQRLWQNANLERPGAVEKRGAAPEAPPTASGLSTPVQAPRQK